MHRAAGGVIRLMCAVHDGLTRLGLGLGAALLGVIFVEYCYEVIMRYVFNAPTSWGAEVIAYSQAIAVFLVMPWLSKHGAHVAVTIVVERLPPKSGGVLSWLIYLVAFVVCLSGAWISLDENIRQFTEGVMLMRVHPIPQWWISVFITYGFLMSSLHFLRKLDFRTFRAEVLTTGTTG